MKINGFANIYSESDHPFDFSIFVYPLKVGAEQALPCDDKSICIVRAHPIRFEIPEKEEL